MLVLTRKPGERIIIGDDIVVTLMSIRRDDEYGIKIRVGVDAPSDVVIRREEVPDIRKEEHSAPEEPTLHVLETDARQLQQKVEAIGCQTARECERAALDAERAAALSAVILSLRGKCDDLLEQLGRVHTQPDNAQTPAARRFERHDLGSDCTAPRAER
jgi:carbon storage regulator